MEKAVSLLKSLNFSESESKVYLTLLQNNPMTGYEASKQSGVPRSKVYNILESLRDKGAVLVSKQTDPVNYSAVDIQEVIDNFKYQMNDRLSDVSEELERFNHKIESTELWSLKGYENVFNRCRRLIQEAKSTVLLQVWEEDLPLIYDELKQFEARSGNLVVILYSKNKNYDVDLKHVYAHGFEEAMLEENRGCRWINLVVDDEALIFGHIEPKNVEVLWTKAPSMVFLAKENVRHDAYCLRLIDALDENAKMEFGPDLLKIKTLF